MKTEMHHWSSIARSCCAKSSLGAASDHSITVWRTVVVRMPCCANRKVNDRATPGASKLCPWGAVNPFLTLSWRRPPLLGTPIGRF